MESFLQSLNMTIRVGGNIDISSYGPVQEGYKRFLITVIRDSKFSASRRCSQLRACVQMACMHSHLRANDLQWYTV